MLTYKPVKSHYGVDVYDPGQSTDTWLLSNYVLAYARATKNTRADNLGRDIRGAVLAGYSEIRTNPEDTAIITAACQWLRAQVTAYRIEYAAELAEHEAWHANSPVTDDQIIDELLQR